MNSAAKAIDFECPKGFSKEDALSQLYFEDIDDNSELWLVRIPADMDPSVLENQVISLNKDSEVIGGNDGKFYESFTEKCAMPNLCLVLPHKESRTLEEIKKPFKGSVLVTDYVVLDSDALIKMEIEDKEKENTAAKLPDEDTSVRKKSKSHKKSKESREDVENSLNLKENDEVVSSQHKTSKKSKKKKSKHSDSLKEENMSDGDDFPNCKSQKM